MARLISSLISTIFLLLIIIYPNSIQHSIVYAQTGSTTASILGAVKDQQNAVLIGASVTVTNLQTNQIRNATANNNGSYVFISLVPGNYEIKASVEGFKTAVERLNLYVGATAVIDFNLELGTTNDVIEVSAMNTLAAKAESSTNINRDQIEDLPSNQRNFLDFALITPRITIDRLPARGVVQTSGISINGQSARFNNITIDGLANNDYVTGSVRSTFSQDAVQEFQVVSDSYSAEFGRVIGGIVNIVTRGGNNEYHGNLFLLNRNDSLNARNAFTPKQVEMRQYQFGTTLSGPIKKDKTFFFTSFERLTSRDTNIFTVNDDIIQAARSQGFNVSNRPVAFGIGTSTVLARLDSQLSANNSLWIRYNGGFSSNGNFEPVGELTLGSSGGSQQLSDNSIAVSETYINGPFNFINELRFIYSRRDQDIVPLSDGPLVALFTPNGLINFGRNPFLPQSREENIYQVIDNVSLTRGKQNFKFGIDYAFTDLAKLFSPNVNSGQLVFSLIDFGAMNGPLLNFLQTLDPSTRDNNQRMFLDRISRLAPSRIPGFPANIDLANMASPVLYRQSFGNASGSSKFNFFSAFIQDDIKVNEKLVLKAGLRYDLNRVKFAPNNSGNFSPRLSMVYSFNPKLTLRASYGLFFGAPIGGAILNAQISNTTLQTAALQFPLTVIPYMQPGHKLPDGNLPSNISKIFLPQLFQKQTVQPDLSNSYSQQISSEIQFATNKNGIVSISYNYVRGIKLFGSRNINPITRPVPGGTPTESAIKGRPDPTTGDNFELESAFDSYYNGLTISANQRLADRFSFNLNYTFAKAIDNLVDYFVLFQEIVDPLKIGNERSLSIQDARNIFVGSATWKLNYGRNRFLNGFELSTIVTANSGRPYNLLAGVDLNRNGDVTDRPIFNGVMVGRNAGITPGFFTTDLRLKHEIRIKERYRFQTIVEAFNLFNNVNINPNEINRVFMPLPFQRTFKLPSLEHGRFTVPHANYQGAFAARQVQVGFRLQF